MNEYFLFAARVHSPWHSNADVFWEHPLLMDLFATYEADKPAQIIGYWWQCWAKHLVQANCCCQKANQIYGLCPAGTWGDALTCIYFDVRMQRPAIHCNKAWMYRYSSLLAPQQNDNRVGSVQICVQFDLVCQNNVNTTKLWCRFQ